MSKRDIFIAIIVAAALIGGAWYYSGNSGDQTASIVDNNTNKTDNNTDNNGDASMAEDIVIGDPNAPVTIIEYSSHLCGHCADFHKDTLPLIKEKYIGTGRVNLVSRLVSPVELSQAVLCANEDGKFSEFNELLFEKISELASVEGLKTLAVDVGLDQEKFNQCFESNKYQERALQWFSQAQEDGVQGTPAFFVNGKKISGNQPYSVFEQTIEEALGEQ